VVKNDIHGIEENCIRNYEKKPEWMGLFGIRMITVHLKEIGCTSAGWFVWLSVKTMNIRTP